MRGRPASLRGRVIITGTLVVAVLVLTLDLLVYTMLRDQMFSNLERVLDAREQLLLGLRDELSPRALADQLDEAGIRAIVRTPDGAVYRSAGAPDLSMLPPGQPDEPFASRGITLPDGGSVVVLASRGGIESTLERLLLIAGAGSVVVVALAFAVFSRLASRVLRPVTDVATTARRIADGDRQERLTPREDDEELRDMILAFNDMLEALDTALAQAEAAEELSRRFLADAAHQLRTPIAGIRASVGTMMHTVSSADREQMLDNLARESARTSRLLSSLLRVARLDSREEASFASVEVTRLVSEAIAQQRIRAPSLDFTFRSERSADAEVDEASLREAVGNLLDNATRHANSTVDVEVRADERDLTIAIRDDGPGVPADARERIFDRFVSLDDCGGSGLGLAIARGIAEAHGGELHLQDGAFLLCLPRQPASA